MVMCTSCSRTEPQVSFSSTQRKKPSPRCKNCILGASTAVEAQSPAPSTVVVNASTATATQLVPVDQVVFWRNRINELEQQLQRQEAELRAFYQKKVNELQKENEKLRATVKELEDQLSAARTDLSNAENRILILERKLRDMEAKLLFGQIINDVLEFISAEHGFSKWQLLKIGNTDPEQIPFTQEQQGIVDKLRAEYQIDEYDLYCFSANLHERSSLSHRRDVTGATKLLDVFAGDEQIAMQKALELYKLVPSRQPRRRRVNGIKTYPSRMTALKHFI